MQERQPVGLNSSLPFAFVAWMSVSTVSGEIHPSFHLDSSAWRATEIALVTEGDTIDGQLMVVESLRGTLKAGEVLLIPELKKFADRSWRTTGRSLFSANPRRRQGVVMSGQRMLVFLQTPPADMTRPFRNDAWRACVLH